MLKKLAVVGLLLVVLAPIILSFRSEKTVVVSTVDVARGDVTATLKLTGTVINDHTVTITALHDGEITSIAAREGALVTAGSTLAELDNRLAMAQLKKAEAELRFRQQHAQSTRQSYNRLKKSSIQGASSQQSLEDSLNELRNASAQLAIAEADLEISQVVIDNSTIRAPFDGSVTSQWAEVGQWVEAGTQLFTVVASEGKTIEVMIDGGDYGRVKLGQTAVLTSDAWPDARWESELSWIAPAVSSDNNSTENLFAARIDIGEDAPPLLLGQQLDVELVFDHRSDVLTLPLHVLYEFEPDRYGIQVIVEGIARDRVVEVGLVSLLTAEITGGLREGDLVINPAGRRVKDGRPVRPERSNDKQ